MDVNNGDCGRAVWGKAIYKAAEISIHWRVSQVDSLKIILFIHIGLYTSLSCTLSAEEGVTHIQDM